MSNLPKIADLYENVAVTQKQDEFNFLMNQEPHAAWIKTHPIVKSHKYIPIDKVEYLLKRIFKEYKIEVMNVYTLFNAIGVSVRVHYLDVVTGQWKFHDGVGAQELQTKKGMNASDLGAINSGAVAMAMPIAKTLAVKDACDHFGKLFGADLNRKDVLKYTTDPNLKTDDEKLAYIKSMVDTIPDENLHGDDWLNIERIIDEKDVNAYNKLIKYLEKHLPKT